MSEGRALGRALVDARSGSTDGLAVLFRAFHPRLLRYLRARDREAAEDVAGETWVAVAQRIKAFEGGPGEFAAWLFTIARQRLADRQRTAIRRATDPVPHVPDAPEGHSPEDVTISNLNAQQAVDLIVATLSADQSEVLLLRVLAGLPPADVARLMGRAETWVRVTHHRALQRLRDSIADGDV